MKILFAAIFFLVFLISCHSPETENRDEIRAAVSFQLRNYPESRLVDIYKSFFQDEFGPGHLVEDTAAAREYLMEELAGMTSRGRHRAEPCGTGKRFIRVPLDLVKDSLIDQGKFFGAFTESAEAFRLPDPTNWKNRWNDILAVIDGMALNIPDIEEDKKRLNELLDQDQPIVHHSQAYIDLYDPHYRIMTLAGWRELQKENRL